MAHLVWDWNGTLLDDLELTVVATNASLATVGGPVTTVEQHRRMFCRPLTEYYRAVLGRPVDAQEFTHLDEEFHRAYRSGLAACDLARDALVALDSWPGTQSLLSMWSHAELVVELQRRGLTGRLIRIDGRHGYALGDLKAGYLKRHIAALGIAEADCVLVGDAVDDADAALAVGARCVLYSGGITGVDVLRATGQPVASTLVEAVTLATALCNPAAA